MPPKVPRHRLPAAQVPQKVPRHSSEAQISRNTGAAEGSEARASNSTGLATQVLLKVQRRRFVAQVPLKILRLRLSVRVLPKTQKHRPQVVRVLKVMRRRLLGPIAKKKSVTTLVPTLQCSFRRFLSHRNNPPHSLKSFRCYPGDKPGIA